MTTYNTLQWSMWSIISDGYSLPSFYLYFFKGEAGRAGQTGETGFPGSVVSNKYTVI